jgi:predicted nucleotidyltransferase component of viral defense system
MDVNKHKVIMLQVLKDIYSDVELANYLGFKGGTAMFLFHHLSRFSVDLDFNLLKPEKEDAVYEKVRAILLKYGKIDDEAKKFFGPVLVLNYGAGERKLKIEISNRPSECRYEMFDFMGINMLVMTEPDMFANKLCALLDRNALTNRDIFDCWFFMQKRTAINIKIVEQRMNKPYAEYVQDCINIIEQISPKGLLNGLGELVKPELKPFIKNKLKDDVLVLLKFYQKFPIEK